MTLRSGFFYDLIDRFCPWQWRVQYPSDAVLREFFGEDTPPISELVKNTSLVMINRHVSVNPARPVNPNAIDLLGIHIREQPNLDNIPSVRGLL